MKERTGVCVNDYDGLNLREIGDLMTECGFKMNHSTAMNYVNRSMFKFAQAISDEWELGLSESRLMRIAKSPEFQHAIGDMLKTIKEEGGRYKMGKKLGSGAFGECYQC
jgi:hypothetical protein